ncbi:MAG: alpha/beta fold hydrolase [Solirubrobacterales bacterium]|nr:alpha/beta fold hydrolase [Solirubrobacterales bacterium]
MAVGGALRKVGFEPGADLAEVARGVSSLSDAQRRQAFVRTVRSVVSVAGQRVNATDRLYLAGQVPTLVVWGTKDPVIPVSHAHAAHAAIPGSRLELFEGCGHFPQLDAPDRFAELLHGFIAGTEPARYDRARLRAALRDGA